MSEKLPRLHAHLEQHKVDYTLITFNWFLVVFVDSVVSDVLFKIWDSFLYEGPKVGELTATVSVAAEWPAPGNVGRVPRARASPAGAPLERGWGLRQSLACHQKHVVP